jgi:hypothetical protein
MFRSSRIGTTTVEMRICKKESVMDRSIMVPLDGSVFSEHALPLALSIAQRSASAVQLVHVHIPAGSLDDVTGLPALDHRIDSEAREFEQEYLTSLAQSLATTWGLR